MRKNSPSFSFSNFFLFRWHPYAWIVVLAFLLFFKTFFYEITHFDDEVWIIRYRWLLRDWASAVKLFFRPDLVTDFLYRPVLALTFLMDTKIYGDFLWGFRLTNLFFHAFNSCLVFALLIRLKYDRALSFVCSLVFLVHPVMTMAVAWIPGRTETVFGFFIFSSFLFFLKFIELGQRKYFFLHLILFILALFSKETGVILPLALGFYLYLFCENKELFFKKKWILFFWGFPILGWMGIRAMVLAGQTEVPLRAVVESVLVNSASVFIHLGKIFFPLNLCPTPIIEDTSLAFGLLAFFLMSLIIWLSSKKRTYYILFGIFWFLIFLLPSLAISLTFYEYRVHVSFLGLFIVLLEVIPDPKFLKNSKRIFVLAGAGLFLLASITFKYSNVFKNAWNFSHASVECSPRLPVAHANLARMYEMMNLIEKAKEHYAKALVISPILPKVHHNLGVMYLQQGDLLAAEEAFLREIFFNPRNDGAHVSFALLRFQQGRPDEARMFLSKALEINPDNVEAHLFLAFDSYIKGDLEKALISVQEFEKRGFRIPQSIQP